MLEAFCILKKQSEFTLTLKEDGTIRNYFISRPSSPQFDSLICDFLLKMPPIQVASLTKRFSDNNACILRFGSPDMLENKAIQQQDKFVSDFRKKNAASWNKELTSVNSDDLYYFVLRSSELGWINCDRFYDMPGERSDVLVKTEWADSCKVFMVFDNRCSILQGYNQDDGIVFSAVPTGQKVKMYSLRCVNNNPELCKLDITTSGKTIRMNGYHRFSLDELENQFYLN